jgi:hypothetical protein
MYIMDSFFLIKSTMAQLKQRTLFENSDAHCDLVPWVGMAPDAAKTCFHMTHTAAMKCMVCCWNLCQFCKKEATGVCLQCERTDCEKCICEEEDKCDRCHELSYPKFTGWSGVCRSAGKKIPVQMQQVAQPPPPTTVVPPPICAEPSVMPPVGTSSMKDFLKEVYPEEAKQVIEEYKRHKEEGMKARGQVAGYPVEDDLKLRIFKVYKIENPELEKCFNAKHELLTKKNQRRQPEYQFKGDGIRTVYHGASLSSVSNIVMNGFETRYNKKSVYGKNATYVSAFPYVSERHTLPDPLGCRVVIQCTALIGNNAITRDLGDNPAPRNVDSGGDGTGHIYALFNNADAMPRYLIGLKDEK